MSIAVPDRVEMHMLIVMVMVMEVEDGEEVEIPMGAAAEMDWT